MSQQNLPTFFISHGGGPWPWLKKEMPYFDILEASLVRMSTTLAVRPRAVLVVSGHWEESEFAIMTTERPKMIYDYGGFPAHTYKIQYPAAGSPEVAHEIHNLLVDAGIAHHLQADRGYDHGTFTPLAVMYPNADVPVLQVSIRSDYDPMAHVKLGRALAPLRKSNVLVVGSGLSYHNLRSFGGDEKTRLGSREFDDWLQSTLLRSSPEERLRRLVHWTDAPSARFAHPREDHLVPLFVAVGAAEAEPATTIYHQNDLMGGVTASSFQFG
jgi:aromatic ring-opening dioxygenase catalytic subunit (LigB family)